MSARPATFGLSTAITLPMSCGPVAPVSAIAASIAASHFGLAQLRRQVGLDDADLVALDRGQVLAAGGLVLADRIACAA